MRLPLTCLLTTLALAPALRAADDPKPAPPAEQLAALKRDMDAANKEARASLEKAKTQEEVNQGWKSLQARCAPFLVRAVELAERHPDDPAALDALTFVLGDSPLGYTDETAAPIERTYALLTERYVASDRLTPRCVRMVDRYTLSSASPEPLLRAILAKNPSRDVRGIACLQLGRVVDYQAGFARMMGDPDAAKRLAFLRPAVLSYLKTIDYDAAERESEGLLERTAREFGDVKSPFGDATLGEVAGGKLFRKRNLLVGKPVPALEGDDVDGKPFKLSDYRGKVVALVFWASWCGPCMAMVPQERTLVRRLEGKPFALVGVNGDEDRPKAKAAMDKEQMTWPSFFDGKVGRGPIAVKWGISSWPTVIVLDAQGVIRHVDPERSKLGELVDALLAEVDAGKK
jgi:thiol-disulfide isomerase/thioredoxin